VEGAVSATSSFFDGKNVARGWQQKFTGGSGASCGAIGQSRTFTFVHMCDRTTPTPPMNPGSNIAFVDEISGCDYAAFMYSQLGCATRAFPPRTAPTHTSAAFRVALPATDSLFMCAAAHCPTRCARTCPPPFPAEYPVTAKGVCNNAGVCGFDRTANTAKCYCNSGYAVADCSATTSAPSGSAVFGALSGGSVIGALCVVAYSFFRLRKSSPAAAPGADGFYASAS
jgi:hypothetical protein